MATQNLVSVEGLEARNTENARKAYRTPDVLAVGTAIKMVQGVMPVATYRDVSNSGYTYFDQM